MTSSRMLTSVSTENGVLTLRAGPRGDLYGRQYNSSDFSFLVEEKLLDDFEQDYALCLAPDNVVHLVAKVVSGQLYYLYWDANNWSDNITITADNENISNLALASSQNSIHLVYVSITNDNRWQIIHRSYQNNSWSNPVIIDTVDHPVTNVVLETDGNDNLHLIVEKLNNYIHQLDHYVLYSYAANWMESQNDVTDEHSYSNLAPYLLSDLSGKIHLVWLVEKNDTYIIQFNSFQSRWPNGSWVQTKTLSTFGTAESYPVLLRGNNRLMALWQANSDTYYCTSTDNGSSWDEVSEESNLKNILNEVITFHQLQLPTNFSNSNPSLLNLIINESIPIEKEVPKLTESNKLNESDTNYNEDDDIKELLAGFHEEENVSSVQEQTVYVEEQIEDEKKIQEAPAKQKSETDEPNVEEAPLDFNEQTSLDQDQESDEMSGLLRNIVMSVNTGKSDHLQQLNNSKLRETHLNRAETLSKSSSEDEGPESNLTLPKEEKNNSSQFKVNVTKQKKSKSRSRKKSLSPKKEENNDVKQEPNEPSDKPEESAAIVQQDHGANEKRQDVVMHPETSNVEVPEHTSEDSPSQNTNLGLLGIVEKNPLLLLLAIIIIGFLIIPHNFKNHHEDPLNPPPTTGDTEKK